MALNKEIKPKLNNFASNRGTHCVAVIVVGNGYCDLSSNPKKNCLYFIWGEYPCKSKHPNFLLPVMGKTELLKLDMETHQRERRKHLDLNLLNST